MLKIGIFCLIVYAISFAIVYKRPLVVKPWEWLVTMFGLKDSLYCMICTPVWISGILSALNMFVLPEMAITPSLVIFGQPEGWLYCAGSILMDMLSVATIVFIMDQILLFITESRKLDLTVVKEKTDTIKQVLHD